MSRKLLFALVGLVAAAILTTAHAQDMTGLNIASDEFTKAVMNRAEIEKAIAGLAPGAILDLSGESLNGLDLSGMDLTRVKLQSARINKTSFKGANLTRVVLDQAWALKSDFSGATQFGGAKLDGANGSNATQSRSVR